MATVPASSHTASAPPDDLPPPPELCAAAAGIALFLDFDGTLAEFAPTPTEVFIAKHTLELLARIEGDVDGALALVTGRPIAQLYALFSGYRPVAAGMHGHELRFADQHFVMAAPPHDVTERVREEARAITHRLERVLFEDKQHSFALHYRANPTVGAVVVAAAEDLVQRSDGHFILQRGNLVAELVPSGTDKGVALAALMLQPPFRERVPVAIGDDYTDEHMFAAAQAFGGYGIVVGARRPTAARYVLRDPASVVEWLGRLCTNPHP